MLAPHLTSYTPPYTFIPFLNPPKILTFQNHNTQSTSQFPHRNPLYNPKHKAPPKSHAEIPNAIQTKATSQHNTIEFLKTLRGTRKSTNSVARLGQCPLAHAPAHPPNLQVSSILLVPPLPPGPSPPALRAPVDLLAFCLGKEYTRHTAHCTHIPAVFAPRFRPSSPPALACTPRSPRPFLRCTSKKCKTHQAATGTLRNLGQKKAARLNRAVMNTLNRQLRSHRAFSVDAWLHLNPWNPETPLKGA